ncbi:PAAR domain-containing protein [Morganella psychrotolerans]|uniref:PAAR domain-containing protein n=1 Tax=Morganella psychrotolerans TaxID=368603 RepID=A0A5M9QY31_9GAMM|nr:PAAR domain-containing protein [Morganella psychrotolerans]KAA8713594.1 PAAR domain-containing protein [Morganella psychrotolerans]
MSDIRPTLFDNTMALSGDKTTTGATCYAADEKVRFKRTGLRIGDKATSCPRCGKTGTIVTGENRVSNHGKSPAIHGSVVQCGCPFGDNKIIALTDIADTGHKPDMCMRSSSEEIYEGEPTLFVIENDGDITYQLLNQFNMRLEKDISHIKKINSGINYFVRHQVILFYPENITEDKQQDIELLKQSQKIINDNIDSLTEDDRGFLYDNYNIIANISNYGEGFIGLISSSGTSLMDEIKTVLKEIEVLYEQSLKATGKLKGAAFYEARQKLLAKLDKLLNKPLAKKAMGIADSKNLKKGLKLNSKSIIQHWNNTEEISIKGYEKYTANLAKYTKYLNRVGWMAVGMSAINSVNDINKICLEGTDYECEKAAVTETAKLALGTGGGIIGGTKGSVIGGSICLAVGVPTGGVGLIVCGVVGGLLGGLAGSAVGEKAADTITSSLYTLSENPDVKEKVDKVNELNLNIIYYKYSR